MLSFITVRRDRWIDDKGDSDVDLVGSSLSMATSMASSMLPRLLRLSMLSSLDDEFGEDLGLSLDDVPGLVDFTLRHPLTLFSVKHQARFEDR